MAVTPLSEKLPALARRGFVGLVAMFCMGCGSDQPAPASHDQLDPMARNKDLPIEEQIKNIEDDKKIPAPEKERYLQVLRAKRAAHP